ncbi:hypothetical protein F8C76_11275 [Flagellimonas olearia]|uniref:Uncharacterized protein n=1 Tax=Flagellimonas olearia TaxID=552546 RepID=A0A6I1DYL0_9FLAO|nr:hypothetical protein [Allomuricauda olearia]KAB7528437.1 hypothetical protein F8C76_11275 [Allomuricauda olearia]
MKKYKKYFSENPITLFEQQFDSFLSKEKNVSGEAHPNGFNEKLGIFTNNLHQLQHRYRREIGEQTAIKKEVPFVDAAPFLFPKQKVNYRYWKAHLKKVGKLIHHCNLHITELETKNVLLKLFNRNVDVPKDKGLGYWCLEGKDDVNYWRIGVELDEVIEEAFKNGIPEWQIRLKNKILFNPKLKLTGKERKSISAKLARA